MRTGRTFWFIVAALCVAGAATVFAGRSVLIESLTTPVYRTLIIAAYLLLGGSAGSLTKAFSAGHEDSAPSATVKVQDGVTYTIVERSERDVGQRSHYWLGDNGREIELTKEEAEELLGSPT